MKMIKEIQGAYRRSFGASDFYIINEVFKEINIDREIPNLYWEIVLIVEGL